MKTELVSRLKSLRFVLVLAAVVVGCDSDAVGPGELPGGVEIRATSSVFGIAIINGEKTSVVSTRIVNNGLTTIYQHYCGTRVYKLVGTDWVEVWTESCAGVNGTFTALPASGVTTVSTLLSNPASPFSFGGPFTFETGVYYRVSIPLLLKTGDNPDNFQIINPRESVSTVFAFMLTL